MNAIGEVLSIAGLFLLRIGLPLLILLTLGTLIDRAYRRREAQNTDRPIPLDMPLHEEHPEEVPVQAKGRQSKGS